jgi:hypothetical protein
MPQFWLKPFGTTEPPRRVDPNWTVGVDLDELMIITGPATARKPPKMGAGDKILFHAVGHVRLYAAGELSGSPDYDPKFSEWGERFPWVYPVRVEIWIPNVLDGPRTTHVAPRRAMGHLQTGGPYASLTRQQYEMLVQELLKAPTVRRRVLPAST